MRGFLARCGTRYGLAFICLVAALWLWLPRISPAYGQDDDAGDDVQALTGVLLDEQGNPIADAAVRVFVDDAAPPAGETQTLADGSWEVALVALPDHAVRVTFSHPDYDAIPAIEITGETLARLLDDELLDPGDVRLQTRPELVLVGTVSNDQGQSVAEAEVEVFYDNEETPVGIAESLETGLWEVLLPQPSEQMPQKTVTVEFKHPHFGSETYTLAAPDVSSLRSGESVNIGEVSLANRFTAGFWVATFTFLLVLGIIAFEKLPNATAALLGTGIVFATTYFGGKVIDGLYIFDFERALTYINWEVIFLVMGMMIVVSVIEGTGLFQWLAFMAYRYSRGQPVILVIELVIITTLASALLDNVTTMLLMVPITLEIALALNLPPASLLVPEILASNVGGISTLIGTPTNILIGAYAEISFNDFLINQTIGVVMALVVMTAYVLWHYRKVFDKAEKGISSTLFAKLEENAKIKDVQILRKSMVVFMGTIFVFAIGETLHMVPAVTALLAATVMLVWVETDVQKMLSLVDWTTLVFFMALFMMVGAIQEVGLIGAVAQLMSKAIGTNLYLGMFVITFGVGILSFAIANIPLAASMLPVVEYLSGNIAGAANNKVLYYGLSMGAAMGGNGLLIGGETNLMTAGVAERAGYPLSFGKFAKVSIPVTILTLLIGSLWLLLRFEVLGG
jgi:Na+/H+ antiporter NhaD/arsenite permease-like protein